MRELELDDDGTNHRRWGGPLSAGFDLASSGGTTILLDFDGDQSVKLTGNDNGHGNGGGKYIMTPVIGIVSVH